MSHDKSAPVQTDCRVGVLQAGSFIQTPKSLYSKGVLNILNVKDDYCFLWCILGHIHRVNKHADELHNYKKYLNELDIIGLQLHLKFSETPKFVNLNPTISVTVLVYENNEVFPLYASKHHDRKHVNLLMNSNNEGKFHYLLVRNLSALVAGQTKRNRNTHVSHYCLYCFPETRPLTAHLPDCSIHPEQKVEYPSPDDPEQNIKSLKPSQEHFLYLSCYTPILRPSWYRRKKI